MFTYISPEQLTEADWSALMHSITSAPARYQQPSQEVNRLVQENYWRIFRFRSGLVAVSVQGTRLCMEACATKRGTFGFTLRQLGKDLQRLAADWSCDTIETFCYDVRHAKAILRAGGKIESLTMTLAAKRD